MSRHLGWPPLPHSPAAGEVTDVAPPLSSPPPSARGLEISKQGIAINIIYFYNIKTISSIVLQYVIGLGHYFKISLSTYKLIIVLSY